MKKILYFVLTLTLIGMASCSNPLKGKFFNKTSDASEDVEEVETEENEEIAPAFEFTHYSSSRTEDCDGIDCNFSFNIDWPTEGAEDAVDNIRKWIVEATLGERRSFSSASDLANAIIRNDREEGNIFKEVSANIFDNGSEIKVETAVSWSAGYSVSSPSGRTVRTAVFNVKNGDLISEDVERTGDDEY